MFYPHVSMVYHVPAVQLTLLPTALYKCQTHVKAATTH
jgi:hypothetical protein